MSARHTSRAIRRALDLLLSLPAEAQAELAERLIERVDVADPHAEDEAEHEGCCEAGDDDPCSRVPSFGVTGIFGPGDPADAEPGEDAEPDAFT